MTIPEQLKNRVSTPTPPVPEKQRWKLVASYAGIGLAILFALVLLFQITFEDWVTGYIRDLLKDRPEYFAVMIFCCIVALLFFFFGALLGHVFRHHFTEIPSVAGQIRQDHNSAHRMFQDWMATANGVLSQAAKGVLEKMWLSYPWEYMALLEEADREYEKKHPGQHIGSVALHGTMVGFAFLLPEALRNHACRAKGQFKELEIFASDAIVEIAGQKKSLLHYPLWLVARLAADLTSQCESFRRAEAGGSPPKLTIIIAYYPHDILNAVIHLPPDQVVALQALDNDGLRRVLEGEELQVGFRHVNASTKPEAYERFEAALINLRQSFWRTKEIWSISSDGAGNPTVSIANPHWKYDSSNCVTLILDSKEYDNTQAARQTFTGRDEVKRGMEALLTAMRSDGFSSNDVVALENLVAEKKVVWQRRHQMQCPCKSS